MSKYVFKRLLLLIPIALGVAFIIFSIMELTPGDPARLILGQDATAEAVAALRLDLGLDRPFFTRFFEYIYNVVTKLDFGESYRSGKPVFDEIFIRLPISLRIAFNAIFFATLVGIPLGVFSAVNQYSFSDNVFRVGAMFFVAMPAFWFAMILILVFGLYLQWVPTSGISSWKCYILPMVSLGLTYGGRILRITRSTMLEAVRQDYVVTAKAKGVPHRRIIYSHALRNALLPIVTTIGSSFGALLGGAIITESVFSMPGLGSLIVSSIKSKDTPIVMGSIILLAVCFSLITLCVDLLYAFIDPRIKAKYAKS